MSVRDDLKAYVDGELTPSREAEVRQAIDADPSLQAEVIELRQLSRSIRSHATQPASIGLESTLLALRRSNAPPPRIGYKRLIVGLGLAATFALAAVFFPRGGSADAGLVGTRDKASEARRNTEAVAGEAMKSNAERSVSLNGTRAQPLDGEAKEQSVQQQASAGTPPPAIKGVSGGAGQDYYARPRGGATDPILNISQAEVELEVADYEVAQEKVKELAGRVQGKLRDEKKREAMPQRGVQGDSVLVLSVPKTSLESLLQSLRAIGRIMKQSTRQDDLTAALEVADKKVAVLKSEQEQYVQMLRRSKSVNDTLTIRKRLTTVRQQIAVADAEAKSVRQRAASASVEIKLTKPSKPAPRPKRQPWAVDAWRGASSRLQATGQAVGSMGIYTLVFAPIWAPAAGLALWLARRKG